MMIKARQQKGAPDAPQQTAEELREAQAADAAAEREAAAQELAFTDADHAGLEQDLAAAEAERAALAARRREAFAALEEARSAVRELQQRKAAKRHTARFERDSGARAREHEAKQVAKRDASDVGGGADEARRHKAATTLARVARGRQVRREMRAPLWAMHGQPGAPMELRRVHADRQALHVSCTCTRFRMRSLEKLSVYEYPHPGDCRIMLIRVVSPCGRVV